MVVRVWGADACQLTFKILFVEEGDQTYEFEMKSHLPN